VRIANKTGRLAVVDEAEAWSHVARLTVGQDQRIAQLRPPAPPFSLGRSFPGFGPTGRWIVTPDTRTPPRFLAPGDELVSTIEGIGSINTRLVAEGIS